jgi:hypothetical protein
LHLTRVVAVAVQVAFFSQISCASKQRRFPCEEPKARQRTSIQDRRVSCSYPKDLIQPPDQGWPERVAECAEADSFFCCAVVVVAPMTATSKATAGNGTTERGAINCSPIEPSLGNWLGWFRSLFNGPNGLPLCLSEIKSGHIRDAIRRGPGGKEYALPSLRCAIGSILVQSQVRARLIIVASVRF